MIKQIHIHINIIYIQLYYIDVICTMTNDPHTSFTLPPQCHGTRRSRRPVTANGFASSLRTGWCIHDPVVQLTHFWHLHFIQSCREKANLRLPRVVRFGLAEVAHSEHIPMIGFMTLITPSCSCQKYFFQTSIDIKQSHTKHETATIWALHMDLRSLQVPALPTCRFQALPWRTMAGTGSHAPPSPTPGQTAPAQALMNKKEKLCHMNSDDFPARLGQA